MQVQAPALISLAVATLLIAFWAWMFNDMLNNENIPRADPAVFRWPPVAKNHWMILFIFFSILTAGYYYFTVYREK